MIRGILYAVISIFAITFIRMVVGIITKGFSDLMKEETSSQATASGARPQARSVPIRGELKACRACGTYVVESTALTDTLRGETVYYCSADCRQKHHAA